MTDPERSQAAFDRSRLMSPVGDPDRDSTATWLESLNIKLVEVTVFTDQGEQIERHVADHTTLPETVAMSLERYGYAAVFPYLGRWALHVRGKPMRYYDTKEAAEMVAIHRG